jgi:hypothetical protein
MESKVRAKLNLEVGLYNYLKRLIFNFLYFQFFLQKLIPLTDFYPNNNKKRVYQNTVLFKLFLKFLLPSKPES